MSIYWIADLPDNAPYTGSDSRIAIDSGGVVHLVYVNGITSSLRYARGKLDPFFIFQHGATTIGERYSWTSVDVDPPFADTNLFDLAVDSKGRAHLCFRGLVSNGDTSSVIHAVFDETAGQFARTSLEQLPELSGLALTIANDDSVHITYAFLTQPNHFRLRYATQAHEGAPFHLEDVDTPTGSISNLSIAAGPAGKVGISYIHEVVNNRSQPPLDEFHLFYAEKADSGWRKDSASGQIVTGIPPFVPGTAFVQIGTNSLVIDGNGVPHIAYFASGLGLRHATWTQAGWGNWVISAAGAGETVDPAGQPMPAKILLDQSNVLHIAYQGELPGGSFELRLATRAGSGGWATATIDPSVNSGWAVSAALDPTGQPHISYGFFPMASGPLDLKHIFAANITLRPLHGRVKRPILHRPE